MQYTEKEIELLKKIIPNLPSNLNNLSLAEREEIFSAFITDFKEVLDREEETFDQIRLSLKLSFWSRE